MADVKETATITYVFHVDQAKDADTGDEFAVVLARLSNDTTARIPISSEAAARLAALLSRACERHGWRPPDLPINEDKIQ